MIGVAVVRAVVLTGLGVTGLGVTAPALAGEAPSLLPARYAGRAPGTVGEASRAPGAVGEASRAPGTVGEASRAPGAVGEASQARGTVGEASQAAGVVGEASRAAGVVGEASQARGTVGEASRAAETVREASQAPETAMGEEADGGRDPFARPVAPGPGPPVEPRPSGLSDLAVDDVVLRGVVTTRDGRLAVLEGPDGRAWVARPGERLRDGAVQEIAVDEVRFLRDAADPVAERVVGKRLRDEESAR